MAGSLQGHFLIFSMDRSLILIIDIIDNEMT